MPNELHILYCLIQMEKAGSVKIIDLRILPKFFSTYSTMVEIEPVQEVGLMK